MYGRTGEVTPINAFIVAEAIHASGLPKGVFNLVCGTCVTLTPTLSKGVFNLMCGTCCALRLSWAGAQRAAPQCARGRLQRISRGKCTPSGTGLNCGEVLATSLTHH